jgi:DNA-binding response OmpR family regulator
VIAIVSSNSRERTAFAALCESRAWPHVECDSLRALRKTLRGETPSVALVRHKLSDGYSDDVIAALNHDTSRANHTKVLVLASAGTPAAQEARQLALGADCVLRDPVRTDVLLEYLARFQRRAEPRRKAARSRSTSFGFAGARLHPVERRIEYAGRRANLTPREVQLAELLAESTGTVVTYTALYSEILDRRFRGETSNLRVLLGKLDASLRSIGIVLRKHVEVIPKTGYRYSAPRRAPLRLAKRSDPSVSAAA